MKRSLAVLLLAAAGAAVLLGLHLTADRDPLSKARRLVAEARRMDDKAAALPMFQAAAVLAPLDLEIQRDYQNAMRGAGKQDEVMAEYEKRAAANSRDPLSLYLAARVQKGDDAIARGMMKVVEIEPRYVPAHRALGLICVSKDPEQAAGHFAECATSSEATLEDLQALIDLAHRRHRIDEVSRWLSRWREIADGDEVRTVSLARFGDDSSVTLGLGTRRGEATYCLNVAHKKAGTRVIAVARDKAGKWGSAETPEWIAFGKTPPSLYDLVSGMKFKDDSEPAYGAVFARAQELLREADRHP